MFVPLYDDNMLHHVRAPVVTISLIAVNVAIFTFFQAGLFPTDIGQDVLGYGVIPAVLLEHRQLAPELVRVPEELTLLTYMFLHGSWLHLIGNMLFLWVFGDNVEDATGHLRFLVFYLGCGIFAGIAHSWAMPQSDMPLVGASGAVAGVIAAYLILHPHVRVWVLFMWRIPLRIPAVWALGFWIAAQILSVATAGDDQIAWWAHLGGLAAGAALILVLRLPGVPLFGRQRPGERL